MVQRGGWIGTDWLPLTILSSCSWLGLLPPYVESQVTAPSFSDPCSTTYKNVEFGYPDAKQAAGRRQGCRAKVVLQLGAAECLSQGGMWGERKTMIRLPAEGSQ